MVKTAGPIDSGVRRAGGKLTRASERSASIHLAEVEHIRKYWTILDTIERVNKVLHIILVPRCHPADSDSVSTKDPVICHILAWKENLCIEDRGKSLAPRGLLVADCRCGGSVCRGHTP
jgi:hypothetical protein